jgi:transposase
VHALLLAHGQPCPVSDLFGLAGRRLLERLALPEPWAGTLRASLRLIDELEREIAACEAKLRRLGAEHRYVPLLLTVPGIGWVLAYTLAAEIGAIERFPSPRKLAGYSGLCLGAPKQETPPTCCQCRQDRVAAGLREGPSRRSGGNDFTHYGG